MRTIGFLPMTAHFTSTIFISGTLPRFSGWGLRFLGVAGAGNEAGPLPAAPRCTHMLDQVTARALDMSRDDARGAVGVLALQARDQASMLFDDRLPPGAAEGEATADRAQRLAMAPPEVDGVPVVVTVVDGEMEAFIE